jgi:peptide deformylase
MKLTRRVIHRSAKTVDFQWPLQNQTLTNGMLEFMHANNGIGLAAPQIGISKRIFVMEVDGRQRACFNPEIIFSADILSELPEGCLSFPGDQCTIKRPDAITVRYQDHCGNWVQDDMVGLEARCFQHELDHLDGIVMHDRKKEQDATKSRD